MYCYFFMLFSFSFGGRIPHPPFVLLFYQYILVWFTIKKKKLNSGMPLLLLGQVD